MTNCPHCGGPIGELAVVCPTCRAAVAPDGALVSLAEEPGRDSVPDHGNYIIAGLVIGIVGALIMIGAGTGEGDDDTWAVLGLIVGAFGGMVLFVGLVGLGVYVGMRQFDDWQTNERERRQG
jgi:hypothetical protein